MPWPPFGDRAGLPLTTDVSDSPTVWRFRSRPVHQRVWRGCVLVACGGAIHCGGTDPKTTPADRADTRADSTVSAPDVSDARGIDRTVRSVDSGSGASDASRASGASDGPPDVLRGDTKRSRDDGATDANVDLADAADAAEDPDRCDVANEDPEAPPHSLSLSGDLGVHDPALIEAEGQYYLFHTGDGLGTKVSSDFFVWKATAPVFSANPSWIAAQIPAATRSLWAPDISRFGGQYHLYYAVSSFGSNRSCIGHATRAALGAGNWTDRGPVICSNTGATRDDWNAIDPNVIADEAGTRWLAFGSFWGGLKMIRLDATGARADADLVSLAARPDAGGAIEAPYLIRRCGFYYLFASFDACCKGADSTYNLRVGRAREVTGPYVDRAGRAMLDGGGTLLLQGGTRWRGRGHNAVVFTKGAAYNAYHSYDADHQGTPTLRISELVWDADGWPVSGGP